MNVFQKRAQELDLNKFPNFSTYSNEIKDEIPKGNVFEQQSEINKEKQSEKFNFLDTLKDISEQVATKGISGVIGSFGNTLNAFGLQQPEGVNLPGQENVYSSQQEVLEKMNRGEAPSFSDLLLLSDEDIPNLGRLPTSKEIQSGIKKISGIGEGKTSAGRIAGRGAEFLGEGLPLGGGAKALASLGSAGLAGQAVREGGWPEGVATAIEIGGSIIPSGIQGRVNPRNARDQRFVDSARNMGFNEREITPLIQSERKIATLKPLARKGTKTQQLFEDISEGAGQIYDQIRQLPNAQAAIPPPGINRLNNAFQNIRNNLSNTLQPSPDKQSAINFIDDAITNLQTNGATPERLINFWQDINSAVNWNAIKGGRKQLSQLKEPISNALQSVSPEINRNFTDINELYSRYKNISKRLKPDLVDSFLNKGEIVSALPSGLALVYGNPMPLAGLGGEVATRILAREMLINPYFQNIGNKLVDNFNAGSLKAIEKTVDQVKEYMTRKHPEEDWSFLTDEVKD